MTQSSSPELSPYPIKPWTLRIFWVVPETVTFEIAQGVHVEAPNPHPNGIPGYAPSQSMSFIDERSYFTWHEMGAFRINPYFLRQIRDDPKQIAALSEHTRMQALLYLKAQAAHPNLHPTRKPELRHLGVDEWKTMIRKGVLPK